jgi:membrane-bound lytic murein transglycosylase D
MKTLIPLLFLPLLTQVVFADIDTLDTYIDTSETIIEMPDTAEVIFEMPDTAEFDAAFDANVDSMLKLYYVEESLNTAPIGSSINEIPHFSDSIYRDRLSKIPTVAELTYNNIVKRYIEVYTVKKRKSVEVMLGLSEHYFPVFDDIFDYYGVPNELKYMAIIESALNPRAYSRARAVGLWQFMYGTGRMYGLEINSLVDERMDPIKSTQAAARFIRDLNNKYDDWLLAIAAYNCGPGNVNKAIRRSGGKKTFWEIYSYLPRETRGHVPAFIAATYTMNYYKEHNLTPKEIDFPIEVDTVMINEKLHLQQVSDVLNIPIKQLRDLNPQYRYDIIPGQIKSYALRLPFEYTANFIDFQDSIFAYKDSVLFNNTVVTAPTTNNYAPQMPGKDYVKLSYTVKSGDAIGLIAQWYNVKTNDLRYWNNVRGNMIRAGQKLAIYKKKNDAERYRNIDKLSYAEKQASIGKTYTPKQEVAPINDNNGEFEIYTVRSGDTLWDIAKLYPGVSDTDIMKWNNMTNGNSLKPGQKLRIKPKS